MVILHNNTESAYDRTARQLINRFFKKFKKSSMNALFKFLKASNQEGNAFDTVFFLYPDYQPVFRRTVEEAYRDALNADCEDPSFIRMWKENGKDHIMVAVECDLYGELDPKDYRDEKGTLKQELKNVAIAAIKKALLVE